MKAEPPSDCKETIFYIKKNTPNCFAIGVQTLEMQNAGVR